MSLRIWGYGQTRCGCLRLIFCATMANQAAKKQKFKNDNTLKQVLYIDLCIVVRNFI
jgi:hypothetical protein